MNGTRSGNLRVRNTHPFKFLFNTISITMIENTHADTDTHRNPVSIQHENEETVSRFI